MSNPAYKKIVEQMWADGRIVPDEISTLVTLQQHLGVCSEDAAELERSVMGMTKEEALVSGMGTNASTAPAAPAPTPATAPPAAAARKPLKASEPPAEPQPDAGELPKQQADLLGLGITLLEAGDTEEADEQFTAVLKYDPTNSTAWMAKAAVAAEDDLSKALSYLSRAGFESASVDLQGQACTWFDSALSELIRDETGWKHQVDSAENLRDLPEVYKHLRHCKSPAALKALKASLSEAFSAGIKSLLGFCREEQQLSLIHISEPTRPY